jgi:hypothetical protein
VRSILRSRQIVLGRRQHACGSEREYLALGIETVDGLTQFDFLREDLVEI